MLSSKTSPSFWASGLFPYLVIQEQCSFLSNTSPFAQQIKPLVQKPKTLYHSTRYNPKFPTFPQLRLRQKNLMKKKIVNLKELKSEFLSIPPTNIRVFLPNVYPPQLSIGFYNEIKGNFKPIYKIAPSQPLHVTHFLLLNPFFFQPINTFPFERKSFGPSLCLIKNHP